jgi:hypothetical protein
MQAFDAASAYLRPFGDHVKRTILIVDRNLAFVFRLGRTLEAAGHNVLPARGIADAKTLLCEFPSPIDVVLIHHATPGAPSFVEELLQAQGRIAVVDLSGERRVKPGPLDATMNLRKSQLYSTRPQILVSASECLGMVEGFLAGQSPELPERLRKEP